jgi:hypothetical protein
MLPNNRWVKSGKALDAHMFSGLPPKAGRVGKGAQVHISSATDARLWRRAHALGREPGRKRVGMARMQTIEV